MKAQCVFAARNGHGENVLLADNTADAGLTLGHLQLMEFCCIFMDRNACLLYLNKSAMKARFFFLHTDAGVIYVEEAKKERK